MLAMLVLGGDPGVGVGLEGVLLGGQAEGVVAHGVHHVVARHAQIAGVDVGADEAERVAHVQTNARGVREHVEHVALGAVGHSLEALAQRSHRVGGVEGALGLPTILPAGLDGGGHGCVVAVSGLVGGRAVGHGR
jgi:hypothetical protein